MAPSGRRLATKLRPKRLRPAVAPFVRRLSRQEFEFPVERIFSDVKNKGNLRHGRFGVEEHAFRLFNLRFAYPARGGNSAFVAHWTRKVTVADVQFRTVGRNVLLCHDVLHYEPQETLETQSFKFRGPQGAGEKQNFNVFHTYSSERSEEFVEALGFASLVFLSIMN
jgi:hypothetical protein